MGSQPFYVSYSNWLAINCKLSMISSRHVHITYMTDWWLIEFFIIIMLIKINMGKQMQFAPSSIKHIIFKQLLLTLGHKVDTFQILYVFLYELRGLPLNHTHRHKNYMYIVLLFRYCGSICGFSKLFLNSSFYCILNMEKA